MFTKYQLGFIKMFIAGIFLVMAAPVSVAQETNWHDHENVLRTRIVAATADHKTEEGYLFAWEARLSSGWKTYWRSPGEAGLPVIMRTSGKEIELEYPYPERFDLFGIETFGYSKLVMIPFRVQLGETDTVKIEGEFMVCKDICIPFSASYDLDKNLVSGADVAQDIKINAWMDKVPVRSETVETDLEIMNVRVTGPKGKQKLIVDVKAKDQLANIDLLAESVPGTYFSKPESHLMGDGSQARLVLNVMSGNTPIDIKGKSVRLTFANGEGKAIDRSILLSK